MHKLVICVYTTSRQRRAINRARDLDAAQQRRTQALQCNIAYLKRAVRARKRVRRWKTVLKPLYRQYLRSVQYATPAPVYSYRGYEDMSYSPAFVTYSTVLLQLWNQVRDDISLSKGLVRESERIFPTGDPEDLLP